MIPPAVAAVWRADWKEDSGEARVPLDVADVDGGWHWAWREGDGVEIYLGARTPCRAAPGALVISSAILAVGQGACSTSFLRVAP